ncbi:hypothetical protein M9H77_24881 [Catharanthus roseus]|uniref:Uncharacterized protein n=1 Tax=Catharanthus roseus TaxID=4058 RepID=A0ACC0A7U9_CATRO|nr:hypothetical protein M9H77_24881 [Catharanthus roseus]
MRRTSRGQKVAKTIRAVVESMLECHFGEDIDMDALFVKYGELLPSWRTEEVGSPEGEGMYLRIEVGLFLFGNCFKTNLFGETHVFVSSTESAKKVLSNESGKFTKKYIRSIGELVGTQSLLCASHQHHKMLRSHLNPLLSTSSLSNFVIQFDELIVESLSEWKHRDCIILLDEALKITLKAICKMLMSQPSEDQELEILQNDVSHVCKAMLSFPLNLPWTRFYKGLQARKRIMKMLQKIINDRRGSDIHDDHGDFLQHLLMNGNGGFLTDEQLKDNILTMIIAGQDTTASAITWMAKYLDDNIEVQNLLREEQLSVSKRLTASNLSLEDLSNMPYAAKVVKESLRMASIVPWLPRLPLEDCELQGYKIKKGWSVNIDVKSVHFDPELYSDPYKFNPSRFDDEPKPYSFLAFGSGGRTCLGLNLARAMMLVFLHRLVTTYR